MAATLDRLSRRVVYASTAGAVADANLDAGTWTTDNSSVLNAVLATASASNPVHLVIDGAYGASQLDVKNGYITIEGMGAGTGLVNTRRSASPLPTGDLIVNSNRTYFSAGTTAIVASHIKIKDLRLQGCRPNSDATRYGSMLVHLENIDDIEISGCRFDGIDSYGIELAACTNVWVDRCRFEGAAPFTLPAGSGQAGVQVEGATSDLLISNCYFKTNDDGIAINVGEAPLGSSESGSAGNRFTISGCIFDGCLDGIRYYGVTVPTDYLTVTNCAGTVYYHFMVLGVEGSSFTPIDQPHRNVMVSNCCVSVVESPFGNGGEAYFSICGLVNNLQVSNFTMNSPTQAIPLLGTSGGLSSNKIVSASISGLKIHYDANGSAADYLWDGSIPIDELTFDGFEQVCDAGVTPTAPNALIKLAGSHGGNRIRLRDFAVRYAGDIVQINNTSSVGVVDSILITGLDASGLVNRAVNLASGTVPTTVVIEGLWSNASQAPLGIATGLTLTNLGTVGLYSTYATPYSGGGTVTNNITKTAGTYGGP